MFAASVALSASCQPRACLVERCLRVDRVAFGFGVTGERLVGAALRSAVFVDAVAWLAAFVRDALPRVDLAAAIDAARYRCIRVYGNFNEDTAITIAKHHTPKGWGVDTSAEWSEDYGCWVVPAYII